MKAKQLDRATSYNLVAARAIEWEGKSWHKGDPISSEALPPEKLEALLKSGAVKRA